MKRYFKTGWYGGATATITTHKDGSATLTVGRKFRKTYKTERGARVALGRQYDGTWTEVNGGNARRNVPAADGGCAAQPSLGQAQPNGRPGETETP